MKEHLKEKLVGAWKLVSWKYVDANNEDVDFFGENPEGILTYDASGYMSAHLMNPSRTTNFNSNSLTAGTSEEVENAFFNYLAYWGRYYEKTPGEIVHQVEGSLFPNWMGQDQIRYGKLEGEYLMLSTPPIPALGDEVVFNLTWKKA